MTRSENRKKVLAILSKLFGDHKDDFYGLLSKPAIPGIWNQPDFLIVPEVGKKIMLFIYFLPSRDVHHWTFALSTIEDLFEVKTKTGNESIVCSVIVQDEYSLHKLQSDKQNLLENIFDFSVSVQISDLLSNKILPTQIYNGVISSQSKKHYSKIWNNERVLGKENLRRYDKLEAESLLTKGHYSSLSVGQIEEIISKKLFPISNRFLIQKEARILNIKNYFLGNQSEYFFQFDFVIDSNPPIIIEIKKGIDKLFFRRQLRSFASKARLIRYEYLGGERLEVRNTNYKIYLLIANDLKGPDYDPYRYINLMVEVGLNPMRADLFDIKKLHLEV